MTRDRTPDGAGDNTYTSGTTLVISEVNAVTGRDRKTITKDCKPVAKGGTGRYPHAYQDTDGRAGWNVPVKDLVAAGHLNASQVIEVEATLETARESKKVTDLRARVCELETDNAVHIALAAERLGIIHTLQSVIAAMTNAAVAR